MKKSHAFLVSYKVPFDFNVMVRSPLGFCQHVLGPRSDSPGSQEDRIALVLRLESLEKLSPPELRPGPAVA